MTKDEVEDDCPVCKGRGVEFRGSGVDTEYRVCERWEEPGHPSKDELLALIRAKRIANHPGGRFA